MPADRRKAKSPQPKSAASIPEEADKVSEADLEEEEQDILAGARCLAEAKEFTRASKLLQDCKSCLGRFMKWYFDFLVCRAKIAWKYTLIDLQGRGKEGPERLA